MPNTGNPKNIEIELRGPLSESRYGELADFLENNGEFIKDKKRVLIDYSTFIKGQELEGRTKDIRLRATNGIPEIIIKLGEWKGSDQRKELSIKTEPGTFDTLVQIYAALGYGKGMLCVRDIKVYRYRDAEFALCQVPGHSYYFEAEKLINNMDEKDKIKRELETICDELELKRFTDEQYFDYIRKVNDEANEIFDYNGYEENYFKKRFNI